ncbi:MAG: hypothetical protein ACRC92_07995 [Peptostreptococcaceae bacterium]
MAKKLTATQIKVNTINELIAKINSGKEFDIEYFTPFTSSGLEEVTNEQICCELCEEGVTTDGGIELLTLNLMYHNHFLLTAHLTNGFKIERSNTGNIYEINYKGCTIVFTF